MDITPELLARLGRLELSPIQFNGVLLIISELGRRRTAAPASAEEDATFDRFYAAYPRREARGKARQAWSRALSKADAQTLIDAATVYATARQGQDPQYTPLPASWLNAERWKDERTETKHAANRASNTRAGVSEQALAILERHYGRNPNTRTD